MKSITRRAIVGASSALILSAAAVGCGNSGHTQASSPSSASQPAPMVGMVPLVRGADGTTASAGGLTLKATGAAFKTESPGPLKLVVVNRAGTPVTSFDRDQTKLMHLIVVRDDFAAYQHVHPKLDPATGTFTIQLTLPMPGIYHAIADFTSAGKRYALRADLTAAGRTQTRTPLPAASTKASTDGYDLTLKDGALKAGSEAALTFTITKAGHPETALQPYLGSAGHLVALRDPDLAYSHVHPVSSDTAAGAITFNADFPTPARYRLYLQFRSAGVVHTAQFTVNVTAP